MSATNFADFMGVGTPELLIILVIILLLFGGSKLPELSKSIGSSIKELRKGIADDSKDESTKKAQTVKESEQ